MDIKVAICQMNVSCGQPRLNADEIIKQIDSANRRGVDIIVFPEMAVPGYFIGDGWEVDDFVKHCQHQNQRIVEYTKNVPKMIVIFGSLDVDWEKRNEDGRVRKYNAGFVAQGGYLVGEPAHKSLLPNYRVFDDERYFHSQRQRAQDLGLSLESLLNPFEVLINGKVVKIGLVLCEDIWTDDYVASPGKTLVEKGAQIFVNLSCSPWTWKKNQKRHKVAGNLLAECHVPMVYCNNAGTQDNGKNIIIFDGNSTAYNSDGSIRKQLAMFESQTEDVVFNDEVICEDEKNLSDSQELHDAIIFGIREHFKKLPAQKALIGISGGIDSAVVVALLVEALGKERVVGIGMPSIYNSQTTQRLAKQLAENLGIEYIIQGIDEVIELKEAQLERRGIYPEDLVKQNIQARERGAGYLAMYAAILKGVYVNTGNKTEIAFGYTTLYGDNSGAFCPLGDCLKWEVYQLAEYINSHWYSGEQAIPSEILRLKPSAELSSTQNVEKNQGDPFHYRYHDQLVRAYVQFRYGPTQILRWYMNGELESKFNLRPGEIKEYFPTHEEFCKDLRDKYRAMYSSVYKRVQAPPIFICSPRSYGYDLRESMTSFELSDEFLDLERQLICH